MARPRPDKSGDVIYGISLSYLAGLVIYLLTSVVAMRDRTKRVLPLIRGSFEKLIGDATVPLKMISAYSNTHLTLDSPQTAIESAFKAITDISGATLGVKRIDTGRSGPVFSNIAWVEYLKMYMNQTENHLSWLRNYSYALPEDIVICLNMIETCEYFESLGYLRADANGLSLDCVISPHEYHQYLYCIRKLQEHIEKKYKQKVQPH